MITTGSTVRYTNPMPDEVGTTYTVKEVNGDRVLMVANTNLPISPIYVALVSDIEEVKG